MYRMLHVLLSIRSSRASGWMNAAVVGFWCCPRTPKRGLVCCARFQNDANLFAHADSSVQAILELHWSPSSPNIITCSADKTLGFWDANAGKRKKTFKVNQSNADR